MKSAARYRSFRRPPRPAPRAWRVPAVTRLELLESRHLLSSPGPAPWGYGLPAPVPFENTGTGLTGRYFRTTDLSGEVMIRTDAAVNFNWAVSPPPAPLTGHDFSVLWTGEVQPRYSATYTFSTISDDGARLRVDGRPLVDDWNDHSAKEDDGAIALQAGRKYDIVLEYYENGVWPAVIQLSWSSASQTKEIIPESQLYPGPPAPAALSGFVTLGGGAGASGLAAVRLTLSGEDDQGDTVTRTTTTGADGSYLFTDLRPGIYEVTRDAPDGYGAGPTTTGTVGGRADGATAASTADAILAIRLGPGERAEGYNFAVLPPNDAPPPPPTAPVSPPPPRAVVPTSARIKPATTVLIPDEDGGYAAAGLTPAHRTPTPLRASDAAFILAGASARLFDVEGGGGVAAAAGEDIPALPPPPANVPAQTNGRILPAIFMEEDDADKAAARVAAADEAFIDLAAVPTVGGALFGEEAVAPPPRRADAAPPCDDPNSTERRVLLASVWMLTTMGAALANPLDYSRRRSHPEA